MRRKVNAFFCDYLRMAILGQKKQQLNLLGSNLRRARVARSITQEVLSGKAELSLRSLQRIEAAEMNVLVTTIMRLQKVLGCPWDELFAKPQADAGKTSGTKKPRSVTFRG